MIGMKLELRGAAHFRNVLRRLKSAVDDRSELNLRFGIRALNWINRNFQAEGALGAPWRKLRPSTIAGRRKGSSKVLQNTGGLRGSFTMTSNSAEARVGTENPIALFHEKGTRPYVIVPKRAKMLAWSGAKGEGSRVGASFSSLITKRTYKRGQFLIFAKRVNHPGLPVRRMLPKSDEIMPDLRRTAEAFFKERTR